jgi:hypothetical protein
VCQFSAAIWCEVGVAFQILDCAAIWCEVGVLLQILDYGCLRIFHSFVGCFCSLIWNFSSALKFSLFFSVFMMSIIPVMVPSEGPV